MKKYTLIELRKIANSIPKETPVSKKIMDGNYINPLLSVLWFLDYVKKLKNK